MTQKSDFLRRLRRAGADGVHSRDLRDTGIASPSSCAAALEAEGIKVKRIEERREGRGGWRFTLRDPALWGDPADNDVYPTTEILGRRYEFVDEPPTNDNKPAGSGWQYMASPYVAWVRPIEEEDAMEVRLEDVEAANERGGCETLEDAVLAAEGVRAA